MSKQTDPLLPALTQQASEQPRLLIDAKQQQIDRNLANANAAGREDTPAYAVLQQYGLLDVRYRKESFDEIFSPDDLTPTSSKHHTLMKRLKWGTYWTPGCGFCLYKIFNAEVTVPPGHVALFIDDDNNYLFAKPGVHNITDPYLKMVRGPISVPKHCVVPHGNRAIMTVPQGKLGYCTELGQPVLLPPGLHSWTSETLEYSSILSLDKHVIIVGPYTILTVDEGYAAITQNNGMQVVLDGGQTHLLTHQKWRFEKFITLKIQTDDLQKIQAASADNVIMEVNSTVVWRIKDVRVAATMAAETMSSAGQEVAADITKLRRDVLKQAIASLAGFIGSVNYSDSFHVAAAAQRNMETVVAVEVADSPHGTGRVSTDNPMFDLDSMSEAVTHANQITNKFGVEIISINIISANPVDSSLTASLATGAVASAEALQAETAARGRAKAAKIEAEAAAITRKIDFDSKAASTKIEAEAAAVTRKIDADSKAAAALVNARADKESAILRAEGNKKAAELLETSNVAVRLATLKASAAAITSSDKFFFGQEPSYMPNVLGRLSEESAVAADQEVSNDGYQLSNMHGSANLLT